MPGTWTDGGAAVGNGMVTWRGVKGGGRGIRRGIYHYGIIKGDCSYEWDLFHRIIFQWDNNRMGL